MNLLHIDSSILGADSVSRELTGGIINRIRAGTPGLSISYRDLAANPIEHLEGAELAMLAEGAEVADFLAADIVVIGAPMYNFTIPSQLKAWIDRVIVVGKTFAYTANGAAGLAGGKRMIVVISRGGIYSENSPYASAEHAETYMKATFGFVGITDIEFIVAEGVRVSPDHREAALADARIATEALKLDTAVA